MRYALLACGALAWACDDGARPSIDPVGGCEGRQLVYCDCGGQSDWVPLCPGQSLAQVCPCSAGAAVGPDAAEWPPLDAAPYPFDFGPGPDATSPDAEPADAQSVVDALPVDARPPDAAPPVPATCPAAPEAVTIQGPDGPFDVFRFEASHPAATVERARPAQAPPADPVEACSRRGVRPWHSVTWAEADAACAAVGWRLCSAGELLRACQGPSGRAWTWGNEWADGACNFREAWRAEGAASASEAPTGGFEACVSVEGVFDLNGNLWEWAAAGAGDGRSYQGAGWRTVANRHREEDLVCAATTLLGPVDAAEYSNPDVGFRCCR